MKVLKRDSVNVNIRDFGIEKNIDVCEWWNGEGCDISISFKHTIKTLSFTYGEFDSIMAVVNYLRSGIKEEV